MAEQRLIVGFHPQVTNLERLELHDSLGATFIQGIDELNAHIVTVPAQLDQVFSAQYRSNSKVRYVELDERFHKTGICRIIPNDPKFDLQYGLVKIMA
ncbi:S8 family serine peptidase, partial [Peribacillus kribbensis]|uniref:S8 family serine peptidase n=1 Tax=Peribacillus kribbensis TaxID=356658 RepID=UPI000558D07F